MSKATFTHGGSVGKNLWLLIRALMNLASFSLLWFGIAQWNAEEVLFRLAHPVPEICACVGGGLCLLCVVFQLVGPLVNRSNHPERPRRL